MKLERNYAAQHQQRKEQLASLPGPEPDEASLRASCRTLLEQQGGLGRRAEEQPVSMERLRRFQQLAGQAAALAAELPADISIHTERDGRGYIDLSAPLFSVDESCSAQVRQTFRTLLCEADQIMLDGGEGVSRLRLVFRLAQE